jgi:hypothetical protein
MGRLNKQSFTIGDFYDMYNAEYMRVDVPYRLYNDVLSAFNTIILSKLFSGSEELIMPYGLGSIYIVKYKPKHYDSRSLSVDFHLTKVYGKTIYHLNEHSDGYKYRLYWSRIRKDKFILKYCLHFVRANKRKLAQIIKHKEHDYIETT